MFNIFKKKKYVPKKISVPRNSLFITGVYGSGKTACANAYLEKYPDTTVVFDESDLHSYSPFIINKIFKEAKGKRFIIICESPENFTKDFIF